MVKAVRFSALVWLSLCASAPYAADLYVPVVPYCAASGGAQLLSIGDSDRLTSEVVRLIDHAIAVADDPRWISSTRPTFVWASETKVACGKAYGYLQSGWRDEDYLAKCDCFHARMLRFMH
jgi:hypothetical protein